MNNHALATTDFILQPCYCCVPASSASPRLCAECAKALPWYLQRVTTEVDHVVPLSQGGTYEPDNLQPLCREHHAANTALEASERTRRVRHGESDYASSRVTRRPCRRDNAALVRRSGGAERQGGVPHPEHPRVTP